MKNGEKNCEKTNNTLKKNFFFFYDIASEALIPQQIPGDGLLQHNVLK